MCICMCLCACMQEGKCHDGAKPAQVSYLKDGKLFTTGFSRMSERQYALWDEVGTASFIIGKSTCSSYCHTLVFTFLQSAFEMEETSPKHFCLFCFCPEA